MSYEKCDCINTMELLTTAFWITTHLMGMLMIILPCASMTNQANQTSKIVSHLFNRDLTSTKRRQLRTFSLQLLHHDAKFSVYGLFNIDNSLILSVIGTIAIYLVILIQFRDSVIEK
ncbi:putative gustatory receptor 28b [Nilaparvata lugens]|uniref:putative gustatory receptor 28b n=1 Tax=Nilaparvata lugens TaxID=108931 RepID=UPI00193E6A8F|nr:putative gustatory receptor 28b [Nilaparvata lugens]